MITSSDLARKYQRIEYKVVAFSYWMGAAAPMTIHLKKVV